MGCGSGGDSSSYRNDSTCLCRQEDATTHAGDIRSNCGADDRRWGCGVVGLQDVCLVCWVLYPVHFMWKRALIPVSAAMLAGSIVVGGCTILCLPMNVYLTVYSVLMACLTASMIQTMVNFQRSQHGSPMNPGAPKQELSWRESVLPQIRSMAQPLVMVMPMLYAGMLLGGISAHIGLIVILMLIAASFVANVLAGMIALSMIHKEVRKV